MGELTNQNTKVTGVKSLSAFLGSNAIKQKFAEVLGNPTIANGFISSLLSLTNNDKALANADQTSIYTSALLAASLKLEINPNLGQAYIIAYNQRQSDGSYKQVAQFQIGYKGIKQLAQRTGKYKFINESDVREGELVYWDRMTGEIKFEWLQDIKAREAKPIIGYMSYFELHNGFKSTFYMTSEELEAHAKEYSQTYKKYGTGLWKDKKHGMCTKTVVKLNISKNGPMSVEMERAVLADQAVIKNDSFINNPETVDISTEYIDNPEQISNEEKVEEKKESIRNAKANSNNKSSKTIEIKSEEEINLYDKISACVSIQELALLEKEIPDNDHDLLITLDDKKRELLSNSKAQLFDPNKMP